MPINHKDQKYSSKKHPILEYIFNKYNPNGDTTQEEIHFTLSDITEGYSAEGINKPASISNTILDLVRKKRPISSRLPASIYNLGYDLRKKTGNVKLGENYAGTFVFVGVGNEIQSWLKWSDTPETLEISSDGIPSKIRNLIRNDESGLFSVIDYCDVFSLALYNGNYQVMRVQNPMKWQPNEIDGFYYGDIDGVDTFFPVEAKALTTGDDINLDQLKGGVITILSKLELPNAEIVPLAVQMVENGIRIAVFNECRTGQTDYEPQPVSFIKVSFNPVIVSWKK